MLGTTCSEPSSSFTTPCSYIKRPTRENLYGNPFLLPFNLLPLREKIENDREEDSDKIENDKEVEDDEEEEGDNKEEDEDDSAGS